MKAISFAALALALLLAACGPMNNAPKFWTGTTRVFTDGARISPISGVDVVALIAQPKSDAVRSQSTGGRFLIGGKTYEGGRVLSTAGDMRPGDLQSPSLSLCGDLPNTTDVVVAYTFTDASGATLESGRAIIEEVRGTCR